MKKKCTWPDVMAQFIVACQSAKSDGHLNDNTQYVVLKELQRRMEAVQGNRNGNLIMTWNDVCLMLAVSAKFGLEILEKP